MSTHDAEPNVECSCSKCVKKSSPQRDASSTKNAASTGKPNLSLGMSNILGKMQKNFAEQENSEEPMEVSVFECGICNSNNFPTLEALEKHVSTTHKQTREEETTKKRLAPSPPSKRVKRVFTAQVAKEDLKSPSTNDAAPAVDRNWAAEFGYGKKTVLKPSGAGDILAKMKMKFQLPTEENSAPLFENQDQDDSSLFRTRGLRGKIKASPMKAPRTLSDSSLSTRKRIENLIRKAREHQDRLTRDKSQDRTSEKDSNSNEEDDDFEGFEDDDESLLIPMANGWVCEKQPKNKEKTQFKTSFWSPDGDHFETVREIKSYCRKKKLKVDFEDFDRALKKTANKVSEQGSQSPMNPRKLNAIVDDIIAEEEEAERENGSTSI